MAVDDPLRTGQPPQVLLPSEGGYPEVLEAIASSPTLSVPAVDGGNYAFQILPFGELGTYLPFSMIREIADGMAMAIASTHPTANEIVAPEPAGHLWGVLVADRLALPLRILRSRASDGIQRVARRGTVYYVGDLHFTAPSPGTKVVVVDDVVSSGGTLRTVIENLVDLGAAVLGVQVVLAKGASTQAEQAGGVPLSALVRSPGER